MRHGKSSWKDSSLPDSFRPLKKRGAKDARKMAKFLASRGLVPNLILCSPAERTRSTATVLAEHLPYKEEIQFMDELYHSSVSSYLATLRVLKNSNLLNVMIVGHNPELDQFVESVCGVAVHLPTAAVAWTQFDLPNWGALRPDSTGDLIALWTPKAVHDISA